MNKLDQIRELMKLENLDYYWVEDKDPHFNEYVPDHWLRRSWVSGFTGSNGVLLIGREHSSLWTDGRYFVQAKKQLGESNLGIKMEKWIAPDNTPVNYLIDLAKNNNKKFKLGYSSRSVSIDFINKLQKELLDNNGELVAISDNLVDKIWSKDGSRPAFPSDKIFIYDESFAGESCEVKLNNIFSYMKDNNLNYHVLGRSDQIAWLLNLRGSDVKHTPIFMAYCVLEVINNKNKIKLFVLDKKIDANIINYCEKYNIEICEYDNFFDYLSNIDLGKYKIWLDPKDLSQAVLNSLSDSLSNNNIYYYPNIIDKLRAAKNPIQQEGMRSAHFMDGLALVKGVMNIEQSLKKESINEYQAAEIINKSRLDNKHCLDLSFETISSSGENAAIIHYAPSEDGSKDLNSKDLYLLDSGGQYLSGTTDVTRVFCFSDDSDINKDFKKYYTLVLKGNLALSRICFPIGTTGHQLDVLARQYLWMEDGCDYLHGTGHGVGSYLAVHEGPHGISPRGSDVALEPGMVVSNEPGIYFEGKFGIRIEDLLLVKKHDEFDGFLCFEKLTLFPYEIKLIDENLLSREDLIDIKEYNNHVYEKLVGSDGENIEDIEFGDNFSIGSDEHRWLKARLINN